ncbi:hypothetical protein [Enhydrobacter sp.]|uniref:hypothetical protein n=1 Tax=Enhydrobacter sp. TaxID=1894999 RepID=UPI0026034875|nr:hypothetical protein [Enhydrobacter sp.]
MMLGKGKKASAKKKAAPSNVVVPFPRPKPDPEPGPSEPPFQVFKFRFRSGFIGELVLPTKEYSRLWYRVQEPDGFDHFIVFDSEKRRFALNVRHLVASQFDWIGEDGLQGKAIREDEDVGEFYFSDSKKPLRLEVEPDEMTLEEFDDAAEDDNDLCQIANFFFWLDSAHEGSDYAERLRISDGSIIWFRLQDLSFVSVPLWWFSDHLEPEEEHAK